MSNPKMANRYNEEFKKTLVPSIKTKNQNSTLQRIWRLHDRPQQMD